ncbi:F-box protein FBW2-like [Magnolia sinica]|uniref:F-box protein FBW2-like n=1 Tax=Magnolia sinica TaxID=86752 RepID=UPI0026599CFF|nr:F-box protein FBW2-like [Magnolia sinica]
MEKKKKARLCSDSSSSQSHGEERVSQTCSCWEGLSPEILALIFVRLPPDEMARRVPFVCRSWRETVAGPYCWTEIDIEKWCRRCNRSEIIDPAVRYLVRRSKGTVRFLSAYKLGNRTFAFIASFGKCLKVLKIPMSQVIDKIVVEHAGSLSMLTVLDISYCVKITSKGLEALGKHCKSLIHLRRNMPPPEIELGSKAVEDEAMAVANTMPGLLHLELGYGLFSDHGLDAILTKCKALCHLDIQGCWGVKMEGDLEERCERIMFFRSPWDDDEYDDASSSDSGSDGQGDKSGSSSDYSD